MFVADPSVLACLYRFICAAIASCAANGSLPKLHPGLALATRLVQIGTFAQEVASAGREPEAFAEARDGLLRKYSLKPTLFF